MNYFLFGCKYFYEDYKIYEFNELVRVKIQSKYLVYGKIELHSSLNFIG